MDITTAVMTMSGYRVAPRIGHLDRVKRICGYLMKFRDATIRFVAEEPDFSSLPQQKYNWIYSVYGDVNELIPNDIPEPLGNYVTTITYCDANLFHDLLTGRSVMGILHLLNRTPIDYFSKSKPWLKQQLMDPNLLLQDMPLNKLWIYG